MHLFDHLFEDVSNIPRDISNAISTAILIASNKIKELYPMSSDIHVILNINYLVVIY